MEGGGSGGTSGTPLPGPSLPGPSLPRPLAASSPALASVSPPPQQPGAPGHSLGPHPQGLPGWSAERWLRTPAVPCSLGLWGGRSPQASPPPLPSWEVVSAAAEEAGGLFGVQGAAGSAPGRFSWRRGWGGRGPISFCPRSFLDSESQPPRSEPGARPPGRAWELGLLSPPLPWLEVR